MKQIYALLVLAALAAAEPPRRFARPFFLARQEQPQQEEAPYPPSGWKPDTPFYLPGEEGEGGAAEVTTEAEATTTEAPAAEEEAAPTTAAPEGDNDGAEARENGNDYDNEPEPAPASIPAGVYYVLLPDGRLQRVNYLVAAAPGPVSENYAIQEIAPYNSPVYAYQTPTLVQILKK